MDPKSQEELIRGSGDVECSNKSACRLLPRRTICEPSSAGTLRYRDLLQHLRHFQTPAARINVCLLPHTTIIHTSELITGDIQVDLVQLSTIELQILSTRVMQEMHRHDREKGKQYVIPLEEQAQ